jgi:putative endopeptidase
MKALAKRQEEAARESVRFERIGSRMIRIGTALVFAVLASPVLGQSTAAPHSSAEAPKAPPPIARGFDLSAIDKSADACTDFYQYACGNWTKDNPTPSDQVHWIRSFSLLQERHFYELRQELVKAAAKPTSPLQKQYGDFFAACMDVDELQKKGLEPLKPALERIAALSDTKGIAALLGELAAAGDPAPLFKLDVEPDPKDASKPILSLSQGGATLLERETYGGGNSPYITNRYKTHLVRVFMMGGDTMRQALGEQLAVLGMEKTLAKAYRRGAASADPDNRYHVLSLAELEKFAPDFDFNAYFSHLTTRPIESVNVANPSYLLTVDQLITSVPLDTWKAYFRWHILSDQAQALPKDFRDADYDFWDGQVGHQDVPTPRWRQCAAITDQAFGEAFAQEWVKRNFTPAAKAGTEQLIEALDKALGEEIHTLPWMSEETKKSAQGKLAAMRNKIGHPDRWRDYSGLKVDRHDFFADLHRAALFERDYTLSKLDKPVDPTEWDLAPTMLKVRYDRSMNSLTIPAGLIQPPFFEKGADPAVNFGALGVVAAHELTHGFDVLGSKYDEHGNVRDWWSAEDRKEFADATSCEVAQYSDAVPQSDDAPPPGQAPLDSLAVVESTAENGGLRIAYRALMEALAARGKAADTKSDGYSESQRFFLSYAQTSCENQTFLAARRAQGADPYSVAQVRVNGAVQNFEEFGKAFQCTKGTPLFPEKSCRVW